jgi:hypothetical protein
LTCIKDVLDTQTSSNWGGAVYCAWVLRDSLLVGDTKRRLRIDADRETQLGALGLFRSQPKHIGHSAEFGRTGLHLPHQVGAMHFHGRFGDADILGGPRRKDQCRRYWSRDRG